MSKKVLFLWVLSMLILQNVAAQDARGIKRNAWMANLADDAPVCRVTIPGAHDACTSYFPVYGVCVQNLHIDEMFDAGVRFFDIRTGYCSFLGGDLEVIDDKLKVGLGTFHGPAYLFKTFRGVMDILYKKLRENPSEFVIANVSFESLTGKLDPDYFWAKNLLYSYFRNNYEPVLNPDFADWESQAQFDEARSHFLTDWRPDITVGEMRGKVLFMFGDWGIWGEDNFSHLPGIYIGGQPNSEFSVNTWKYPAKDGEVQTIKTIKTFSQNKYEGEPMNSNIEHKFYQSVVPCCEKFTEQCVQNPDSNTWCISLCSGYVPLGLSILCSTGVASRVNSQFARYLGEHPESYPGIVLCDFAGDYTGNDLFEVVNCGGMELIDALISNNRRFWNTAKKVDKRTPIEIPSN